MKLMADDILVHDFIKTGEQPIYEFPIPLEAAKDGVITFSWTCGEGGLECPVPYGGVVGSSADVLH